MTGECTYPIYYQRVVSVDKGNVIIRYKKNKLAPVAYFKHDRRMYLCDIQPGSWWCRKRRCDNSIYYQGVVGIEKGGVTIRYKLAELIKKAS